jgi:hypothetical protein
VLTRSLITIAALCGAVAGCSRDDGVQSDAERFCGEAIAQRSTIIAPPLGTEAELEATLEFYRLMGQLAPIAIAEEWGDIVVSIETAATVVPGDPDSEQLVAKTAYATERSAFVVKQWLLENCGVDIPITTIAPQEPQPAQVPTTTIVDETDDTTPDDN